MRILLFSIVITISLLGCNDPSTTTAKNKDSNQTGNSEAAVDTAKARQELNAIADDIHGLFKKKDMGFVDKHIAKDGIYAGTDPNEVWTYTEFRSFIEKAFKDTALKISDYSISRRDIDVHGSSAVIVDQFMLPELSTKVMVRLIGHARYENGKWMFDLYSWNFIPKNEDLSKINKAL